MDFHGFASIFGRFLSVSERFSAAKALLPEVLGAPALRDDLLEVGGAFGDHLGLVLLQAQVADRHNEADGSL